MKMFEGNNGKAKKIDSIGDNHIGTSAKTPLRADAFEISDEEKRNRMAPSSVSTSCFRQKSYRRF